MKNFINVVQTEEEQVEQIKKWIKENSLSLILGVGLGFGGIFGYGFYQSYIHKQNLEARSAFLTNANVDNHTYYKAQKQLLSVKSSVEKNDYKQSIKTLEAIDTSASDDILTDIKNLKLARLYLQENKPQQAIDIIKNNNLNSANHLRGDIYLAQGKKKLALEFYQLSLKNTQNIQVKAIIDLKINNLK